MYVPIDDLRLSQGDIIKNVVFGYLPDISDPALYLASQEEEVTKDLTRSFDPDEELIVMVQAHKAPVLVISPDCNIDSDDYISVSRIIPFTDGNYDRITNPERRAKFLQRNYQHTGVNPTVYLLQEDPDIGFLKSLASLLEIFTIRKTPENTAYLQGNRILRLSREAVGDLQYRIGYFFGRFAVDNENYMLTANERALL